jgi:DNA-binding Lrp family transcriptional regulator
MTLEGLDDVDMAILSELQRDARHASSGDIAESRGISPSTVRKRIQRLESEEIVTGYHATVNYEKAGYPLYMLMFCTAPIPQRESLAEQAREVPGVVNVREIATGEENLLISVVAENSDDLTEAARSLSELGLAIAEEELIRGDVSVPFSGFATGSDALEASDDE